MQKRISCLLMALVLGSPSAFAGEKETMLGKKALDVGARTYGSTMVRNYINNLSGVPANQAAGASPGSAVVGGIQLALSLKAFSEAKTDKQKAYAAATAIADGVSIANPAVGALMQISIAVRQMAESILDAESFKRIGAIQTGTLENLRRIEEIQNKFTAVDIQKVLFYQDILKSNQKQIETLDQKIETNSAQFKGNVSAELIDQSLELTQQRVLASQFQLDAIKSIAGLQFQNPEIKKMVESQNASSAQIEKFNEELRNFQQKLSELTLQFAKAKAQVIMNRIREANAIPLIESAAIECRKKFRQFISRYDLSQVTYLLGEDNEFQKTLGEVDPQNLLLEGDVLLQDECSEISRDRIPDKILADSFTWFQGEVSRRVKELTEQVRLLDGGSL